MMNTKMYYGWGTDNNGWANKQYAKRASDLRKIGGHVEIMVSKVDADGWCHCEWVRALVDLSKAWPATLSIPDYTSPEYTLSNLVY